MTNSLDPSRTLADLPRGLSLVASGPIGVGRSRSLRSLIAEISSSED